VRGPTWELPDGALSCTGGWNATDPQFSDAGPEDPAPTKGSHNSGMPFYKT